jgi:hypothetical protein
MRFQYAIPNAESKYSSSVTNVNRCRLERQSLFNGLHYPGIVAREYCLRVWNLKAQLGTLIGCTRWLSIRIATLRHTEKQNATLCVRKHAYVKQELATVFVTVPIEFAFVFQVKMFFEAGLHKSPDVSLTNVA